MATLAKAYSMQIFVANLHYLDSSLLSIKKLQGNSHNIKINIDACGHFMGK